MPSRETAPAAGDLVLLARTLKRESQAELGRSIGRDASTISCIESGARRITPAVAERLGRHFFGDEDEG